MSGMRILHLASTSASFDKVHACSPTNQKVEETMTNNQTSRAASGSEQWLKQYYFSRAAFSVLWVAAALTIGRQSFAAAAALLILYPAWDALANVIDATRSGGLAANRSQAINVSASSVMTIAVIVALTMNMNWVLGAFGLWAIFSGLLQLGTAVRRWKTSGRSVGDDFERWANPLWPVRSSSFKRKCRRSRLSQRSRATLALGHSTFWFRRYG